MSRASSESNQGKKIPDFLKLGEKKKIIDEVLNQIKNFSNESQKTETIALKNKFTDKEKLRQEQRNNSSVKTK